MGNWHAKRLSNDWLTRKNMYHSINLPDNNFQNVMGNNAEKVSLYFSILASHFWTWCRVLHDKYTGVVIKTKIIKILPSRSSQ